MTSDSAILILSCDKFSDLWKPFFTSFWKYWPDCPYKVYLESNEESFNHKKVINLKSGKDKSWSHSLKTILKKIPEDNIFVWMEDVLVTAKVNPQIFKLCFDLLRQKRTRHIHFRPIPEPDKIKNKFFGEYNQGIPYQINAVGFWKKKYLESLLIDGETAWNFEIMGSYRASYQEGFYCLLKPAVEFLHLVEKGYWFKSAFDYCKTHNIKIDFAKRPVQKLSIVNLFKDRYFKFMIHQSWTVRVKIMNLLRKLLVSY